MRRRLALLPCALLIGAAALQARAALPQPCDAPVERSAAEHDRLLRFAALIRDTLQADGRGLALIARSGLELERFGIRHTHAGFALRDGLDTPWAVRQLYYACEQQRPQVFDQGLPGFLLGLSDAPQQRIAVLLLPEAAAAPLRDALLDTAALRALLGDRYSANAFPFSTRYQNCNQWVAELMARAWAPREADGAGTAPGAGDRGAARERAQRWLLAQGYRPAVIDVRFPPIGWLPALVPWLHADDHPAAERAAGRLRLSLPASLETFVRERLGDGAVRRLEFCLVGRRAVVREGWEPMPAECEPAPGDRVERLT